MLKRRYVAERSIVGSIEGGWQPKYYIECYISKCWSYPEVYESARNFWPLLVRAEKSKMASKMAVRINARGCCI